MYIEPEREATEKDVAESDLAIIYVWHSGARMFLVPLSNVRGGEEMKPPYKIPIPEMSGPSPEGRAAAQTIADHLNRPVVLRHEGERGHFRWIGSIAFPVLPSTWGIDEHKKYLSKLLSTKETAWQKLLFRLKQRLLYWSDLVVELGFYR